MRVMVLFDLPTVSRESLRDYNRFRKMLIKSGFFMMQESVYCKIALNASAVNAIIENLRKNKPESGLVQVLTLTEKQFGRMEILVGEVMSETLNTDERLVIL